MHNLEDLISQSQQEDLSAFDGIVRQYQDMAVAYAYSILHDFQLAEDAAQEAFIQAYRDLKTLQEPRAFPAWLRRIVFKHCDRFLRKKRIASVSLDVTAELVDPRQNPLESVQEQETRRQVLGAINALPEHERVTTALFYINGYSINEVGEFLEVPESTIKNRLHSARKRLRERMIGLVEETLKQNAPGEQFSRQVKKVIEGIERIHWSTSSVLCFVGSVVAAMHALGEDFDNDYVMGVSGGAFKLFWHPAWALSNCDLLMRGEEPIRRTFAALGYDYQHVEFGDYNFETIDGAKTREKFKPIIVQTIDSGRPVIAQGVVGPPECCVVAGYDKGGDVLYGRSYFQEDPNGYFRTDDWYACGLILIGDKKEAPPRREILKNSLEWAIQLARESSFEGIPASDEQTRRHISGLAAYDVIADELLKDDNYPADCPEVLTGRLMVLVADGVCLLKDKRYSAVRFLKAMAEEGFLGSDELKKAAEEYLKEVVILEKATRAMPRHTQSAEEQRRLADRRLREDVSTMVREAKVFEERAVGYLEDALKRLL